MHPQFRNLLTLKAAGILQEIEDISTNEVILMSTWWSCRTNLRPVSRPWGSRWRREYFYFLFGACGMCIWYYLKLKSWKNLLLSRSTIVSEEKLFSMYMYLSYLLKKGLGIRYTWVLRTLAQQLGIALGIILSQIIV